jgi:SOS-response transcriptional repressor LexA
MLSGLQSQVLNFIVKSINENDLVPTFREIAEGTGFCISSCRNAALELEAMGYIRRREHRVRAISVLKLPEAA